MVGKGIFKTQIAKTNQKRRRGSYQIPEAGDCGASAGWKEAELTRQEKTKPVARSSSEWRSLKDSELEGLCTLDGEATLRRGLRVKSRPP